MWPIAHSSGTVYYDPDKASTGYTVWAPLGAGVSDKPNVRPSVINLIDMRGNVVHSWKTAYPVNDYETRLQMKRSQKNHTRIRLIQS